MRTAPRVRSVLALCLAACVSSGAFAQSSDSDTPEWVRRLAIDPESPAAVQYAQQQKTRLAAEKQLRKIRLQHFGPIRKTEIRQEGIVKLREFTDPALFPTMIKIFEREGADVKAAMLDHFSDSASDQGDAALTWVGVFDDDDDVRSEAEKRLQTRIKKVGHTPVQTKLVVFEGLRSSEDRAVAQSARFAANMGILETIPWLIAGQVQGAPQQQTASVGTGQRNGALAWIMVGQQTAFVSDLQPVVGPNAVAFDPQLSTVTSGVILRVMDAVVITYHVDIHNALIDLTTREWGQSTEPLGWNVPAWHKWYRETFIPHLQAKRAQAVATPAAPPAVTPAASPVAPKLTK